MPSRSIIFIRRTLSFVLALFITACGVITAPVPIQTPVPTFTPIATVTPTLEPPVDAFAMNQHLAKTVNLAGALEAPNEGDWGVTLQAEYFQLIKQKGFTAIRLPIRWNAHALKDAPFTIDPTFFERVDWAVEQALKNDLAIIVNVHNYEELITDLNGNRARFISIWQQIAEHYKYYPNALLFEPLNEPNGSLNAKHWNDLIVDVLAVIRASNPTRTLVIGPADWNSIRGLEELRLPADDQHIIVTFHYYNPYQFTHQGAEWVNGSAGWVGTQWGSNAEKQMVEYDLDQAAQWANKNPRPIFLGEFGAYSKADMESRVKWTTFVAREAEQRGFSWGYWEFCSSFGVYDPVAKQWRDMLVQALLPVP